MLAALERSRLAQRQLVSDASHELRTPLTSVQANLDALAIGERAWRGANARGVAAAAQAQMQELTVLVSDLVDLSKTEVEELEVEDVRLDLAAAGAIERARLHAPQCRFVLDPEPCLVRAAPARLDRAIANLLDNAVKWNPRSRRRPGEVRVRGGRLRCATTARGSPRRTFPACSTASTARRRPRSTRVGAGTGDRAPDGRGSRRDRARRQRSRRRREVDARAPVAADDRRRARRLPATRSRCLQRRLDSSSPSLSQFSGRVPDDVDMTKIHLSLVVLAGVALLVAGCGSSSSPGVAHLSSMSGDSNANTGGKSSSPETPASTQQKMVGLLIVHAHARGA